MTIFLLKFVAIMAQVVAWDLREETNRLTQVYWDACLYPGGKQ